MKTAASIALFFATVLAGCDQEADANYISEQRGFQDCELRLINHEGKIATGNLSAKSILVDPIQVGALKHSSSSSMDYAGDNGTIKLADNQLQVNWQFLGRQPKGDHYRVELSTPGQPSVMREVHFHGNPIEVYRDVEYLVVLTPNASPQG